MGDAGVTELNVLACVCIVLQIARALGWVYARISYTDTRLGDWIMRGRNRRRLRRWIAKGYRPHMDDRR